MFCVYVKKITVSQYFFVVFSKLSNIDIDVGLNDGVLIDPYSQIAVLRVLFKTVLTALDLKKVSFDRSTDKVSDFAAVAHDLLGHVLRYSVFKLTCLSSACCNTELGDMCGSAGVDSKSNCISLSGDSFGLYTGSFTDPKAVSL